MNSNQIHHFRSVDELHESVDKNLEALNKKIDDYSKLLGEKIRSEEKNDDSKFSDLKEKLDIVNSTDSKNTTKKKSNSKNQKQRKTKKGEQKNWIQYQDVHLYNGIGTRGELELYFKSLEDMKAKAEKLKNTKETITQLISTGIKKDLGCVGLEQENGSYQLAFVPSELKRPKFTYKSIMTIGCEL
ncbi:hypothetical protein [Nitrosopumilus sp. S6]